MAKAKPSGAEWEKWKAKEEAHWAKHNKGSGTYFEWNGERWKLDNKATKGQPRKFSPKSVDQKNTENKKVGGHREKMLEKQTAPDVDPKEAQAARARINAKGNEHHHINSRTRVEKGLQAKYGGEIPDPVRKQFANVDQYFGDDPRNFADLTIPEHRTGPNAVHKVEKYMDDAIKKAGSEADNVFGMFRRGAQLKRTAKGALKNAPLLGGVIMGGAALLSTGSPAEAAKAFVETENPIENLDAGPIFDEREDYGKVIQDAKKQNASPLWDRLRQGVLGTRAIRGRSGAQKALQQQ
jgi:hypothetical protein